MALQKAASELCCFLQPFYPPSQAAQLPHLGAKTAGEAFLN